MTTHFRVYVSLQHVSSRRHLNTSHMAAPTVVAPFREAWHSVFKSLDHWTARSNGQYLFLINASVDILLKARLADARAAHADRTVKG